MRHTGHLLHAFIKNPAAVGAVVPSSQFLASAMTEGISVNKGETLLELGPGTGPFTQSLDKLIADPSGYLGIERSDDFIRLLRRRFPHLNFIHGDATEAHTLHDESDGGKVRFIISGLPFASLPKPVTRSILDSIDYFMTDGCMFRTFQYVHAFPLRSAARFRDEMSERYGPVSRSAVVFRNIPPAYVLDWTTH